MRHSFAGNDSRFLSPNGGFVVGKKSLRARGSVYRSFRAPTLNELYREFSAGNTTTRANAALQPETMWGAEMGVDWMGENSTFRATAYRNSLDGLITNVTISSTPAAIVRQRANAAAAVSRGVEAEFQRALPRLHRRAEIPLRGIALRHRVPGGADSETPGHRAVDLPARGDLRHARALRSYAYQFDDDLNVFRLPGYGTSSSSSGSTWYAPFRRSSRWRTPPPPRGRGGRGGGRAGVCYH